MFSVVIPLYNKEAYIEKCIQSVLEQTFPDFELIIVNDGSTDNSLNRIKQYDDRRIRVIEQSNSGVSTARNQGVKVATHDYIAFLDADDWWDQAYLDAMSGLIKDFPEAGIYASKYNEIKHGNVKEANIGLPSNFSAGYINYFEVYTHTMWMPVYPSSAIVQREAFEKIGGFKSKLKLGEDFDLWVRLALKYKVAYLNKSLVCYNQDVDRSSRGVSRKIQLKETFFTFQLDYLEHEEKKNPQLKKLLDNLRIISLEHYYIKRKYRKEVLEIISKVDFKNVSGKVKYTYILPYPLAYIRYYFYKGGSWLKRFLNL